MTLQLSRLFRAHTKTETFLWCKNQWMQMSPKFREIRSKSRSPMDKCFWCQYAFADGDMMALAALTHGTNKVLCQCCAGLMQDAPAKENKG